MATMVVLPADHVIKDTAAFQKTLATAAAAAEETGALVTIGIKPTWACPGFGYIEHGKPVRLQLNRRRRRGHPSRGSISRKTECGAGGIIRPRTAISAGTPACLSGRCRRVLSEFNRHAPELANFISQLSVPERFREALAGSVCATAENFLRLRDHGKGGSRARGRSGL